MNDNEEFIDSLSILILDTIPILASKHCVKDKDLPDRECLLTLFEEIFKTSPEKLSFDRKIHDASILLILLSRLSLTKGGVDFMELHFENGKRIHKAFLRA